MVSNTGALVAELQEDLYVVALEGTEIEKKYAGKIAAYGKGEFLFDLFMQFHTTKTTNTLFQCAFVWFDISFEEYLTLFFRLDEEYSAFFDFLYFSGGILRIDVRRLVETESRVSAEFAKYTVENGTHRFPKKELVSKHTGGMENSLWDRLEQEGAPMLPLGPELNLGW